MTAFESDERIGCQTEQVIIDKTAEVMFYEKESTVKSLTYFFPEQLKGRAKIRKSFSMVY